MTLSTQTAHGGRLVDLAVDIQRAAVLKAQSRNWPGLTLNTRQLGELELLIDGSYSPLTGFMTRPVYECVLERMQLADGLFWPLPVCLDVDAADAEALTIGEPVALLDAEGFMPAVLHVEDIWPIDKSREAEQVFGTADQHHPGVARFFKTTGSHYVGGRVEGIQIPLHFAFRRHRLNPGEIRGLYAKMGWRRVVGFETRNPLHRNQFEITLNAMARANASLLLQPVVQRVSPGDIDAYTRVRCYLAIASHYPPNMMLLSLLSRAMRLAGPKEALLQAIIRKNYGCTHFIVAHDQASPPLQTGGHRFYPPMAAAEMAQGHEEALGIKILACEEMVYVNDEDEYCPASMAEGQVCSRLSDEAFHQKLKKSKNIPGWFSFPEVVAELRKAYPPRHRQGFTVFCTGLSGAGKSTIARVLYARFLEMGTRPVTLLDGDIVRRNLSSELGFSKKDRDINVRRIGFVASEITKNHGIAICAPIAPYRDTRQQIRESIETYGGFIEVHVGTPLAVCESRDRKGLYAKARAGVIKDFTGIDDPYEAPLQPEVFIDTTAITPDEAVQEILLYLERAGFIK